MRGLPQPLSDHIHNIRFGRFEHVRLVINEAVHEHLNSLLLVQVAHPAVVTLGFRRHGRIREGSTDAGEDVFFS